jgi:hypothetical protein
MKLKSLISYFSFLILLSLFSCVAKRVEMPVYEGIDIKDVLSSKNNISKIETRLSIIFEQNNTRLKGDGVLNVSRNGDLSMRLYSFGFLVFEIISEDGVIRSTPMIDRNEEMILTYGLRDCLFWWDIKDFEIEEKGNNYLLKNLTRKLWIDRKTVFPVKQIISLEDGRELYISYEKPEKAGDIWYPSRIRIELLNYSVTLKIKDISFCSHSRTICKNHNWT